MNRQEQYDLYKAEIENALEQLPMAGAPDKLREAMRYSLLSGGKRLRGVLALAACELAGGDKSAALPFACALEMIHAYSLIHDDLPAMDNDHLRRGKPTSHVVYGEALAILAGDALLSHAFEVMAQSEHPKALTAIREIARAAGIGGMLAGQTLDVTMQGEEPNMDLVRDIHQGKTAALLTAPVTAGLILGGASGAQIEAGRRFGYHLGMAFQIVDDLLDIEGDPDEMGKTLGKDEEEGKLTWPACVGIDWARQDAADHIRHAVGDLSMFGQRACFLQELAQATLSRTH